jgi:hypothetical protein
VCVCVCVCVCARANVNIPLPPSIVFRRTFIYISAGRCSQMINYDVARMGRKQCLTAVQLSLLVMRLQAALHSGQMLQLLISRYPSDPQCPLTHLSKFPMVSRIAIQQGDFASLVQCSTTCIVTVIRAPACKASTRILLRRVRVSSVLYRHHLPEMYVPELGPLRCFRCTDGSV